MRLTHSSHPNNPYVGHIEKNCSNKCCTEKVMVSHECYGKKCWKCFHRDMKDLGYYDVSGMGDYYHRDDPVFCLRWRRGGPYMESEWLPLN